MPETKWYQYKAFSGFAVRGTDPFVDPVRPDLHVDRAVWLAGQLEAPRFGSVQGYDGAGMSGGILHNIAVSPKSLAQGSFFTLLRGVLDDFTAAGHVTVTSDRIKDGFAEKGWDLARDGALRDKHGVPVTGGDIRGLFGDRDGKVPKAGPAAERAKRWALDFASLFADPRARQAQSDYAARWLAQGNRSAELAFYNRFSDRSYDSIIGMPAARLPGAIELAMCVYHAFSVNAPGPAGECLARVADGDPADPMKAAKRLIRLLGTKKYARWHDEPGDGGNRYDKTRRAVWSKTGLWDRAMARDLMPTDL